jgi:hypothetical protein
MVNQLCRQVLVEIHINCVFDHSDWFYTSKVVICTFKQLYFRDRTWIADFLFILLISNQLAVYFLRRYLDVSSKNQLFSVTIKIPYLITLRNCLYIIPTTQINSNFIKFLIFNYFLLVITTNSKNSIIVQNQIHLILHLHCTQNYPFFILITFMNTLYNKCK